MAENDKKPIIFMDGGLDRYMAMADETASELLDGNDPLVAGLRKYDEFMRRDLWTHTSIAPGLGFVLAMNACMMFLGGVRMALSGHSAAVFPILRTALESASYAVIIQREPELGDVWSNRHESATHRRECRNKFSFERGVRHLDDTAPELLTLARQVYEGSIDYGAHPNVKGVAGHLSIDEEREDENIAVTLTALYGSGHIETVRGLCACLDFGLSIIALIALADPEVTKTINEDLQKLSDLKNEATAIYMRVPEDD